MPRLCERGAEVLGIRSGELFDGHIFTSNGFVVNVRLWMTGALRVLLGNVRKDGDCGGRLISATWDWPTLIAALEVGEGPGGYFVATYQLMRDLSDRDDFSVWAGPELRDELQLSRVSWQ